MSDASKAPNVIDVVVVRDRPFPILPWILAGLIQLGAVAVLVLRPLPFSPLLGALALHLAALAPIALAASLTLSERALGTALVFALPIVGVPLAALALGTEGRSEMLELPPEETDLPDRLRADELRRLGEALPCCEALLSGEVDERRAIISTLTRRADADAVALLRWALGAPDPDLAVEAALALEEITASFESRLAAHRAELAGTASSDAALEIAELITHAIDAGIADAALVPKLAHEARRCYTAALDSDSDRAEVVALGRARLELAVLRPDTALACIDAALEQVSPEAQANLLLLREEAVLASHALPWEGPSALATYQSRRPPPLTARRRYGTGRRPVGTGGVPITIGPVQVPAATTSSHVTREVRRDGGR